VLVGECSVAAPHTVQSDPHVTLHHTSDPPILGRDSRNLSTGGRRM